MHRQQNLSHYLPWLDDSMSEPPTLCNIILKICLLSMDLSMDNYRNIILNQPALLKP